MAMRRVWNALSAWTIRNAGYQKLGKSGGGGVCSVLLLTYSHGLLACVTTKSMCYSVYNIISRAA